MDTMVEMPGVLEPDIREKFRRSGYTLTSQRRAVLDALNEAGDILRPRTSTSSSKGRTRA